MSDSRFGWSQDESGDSITTESAKEPSMIREVPEFEEPQEEIAQTEPEPKPEAEASQEEPENEGEEKANEEAAPKKKKGGLQKRMDKLTRKWKESNARELALQRKIEEMERENARNVPKPDPIDFETIEDYDAAMNEYESAQNTVQEDDYNAVVAESAADIKVYSELWDDCPDDFDEVVQSQGYVMNDMTLVMISEMEEAAPEVLYHIASNPELALSLSKYRTQTRLEKALNKIVDSLGHEEAEDEADEPEIPSSKKTTKAPEPINPVGGRNSAQSKAMKNMSQAEYNAHMDKVESEKGRFW